MIPHSLAARYSLACSLQSRDEPWTTGLADLVRGGFENRRYINQTDQ